MKKIIYICDKCGAEIQDEIYQIGKDFDLCTDCADKFQNVLAGFLNQKEEQPKQEPKKSVKENGGARHKVKLDLGKVGALYTAGWKIKEIAGEVKCSEQTVRNHLKEALDVYRDCMEGSKNGLLEN